MQEPLLPLSYSTSDYLGEFAGQKTLTSAESTSPGNEGPEDLSVIFNTAFVRSRAPSPERDLAAEVADLMKSPAYQAIMNAAQQLSQSQNISELDAAEQIIATFKKMDDVWAAYLIQEGLARITN